MEGSAGESEEVRKRRGEDKLATLCVSLHKTFFVTLQAAVEEAVSRAKGHYEGVVGRLRGEWEEERERMADEIRSLESQIATLMQGRCPPDLSVAHVHIIY